MSLSDIEFWFYNLDQGIDEVSVLFHRGSKEIFEKFSQTTSTSIFTSGNRKMDQARGVKMVADELLAATGTVVGGTLGFFAAASTLKPAAVWHGAQSGEAAGRGLGSAMWSWLS